MAGNYPKYHQMGVQTRLAEERSRRKAESARYEMQGNPLDDLKAMQEYQNKRQTFQMNQNKMLKSQGDAFALDIYSILPDLDKDGAESFMMSLRTKYSDMYKANPGIFEVDEDYETWKPAKINKSTRRLGKDSLYETDVPPGVPALMEYRDTLIKGSDDWNKIQQFITNKTAEKDPTGRTAKERADNQRREALPTLQKMAQEDPNKVYAQGYRMEDNGDVFVDAVTKAPVKLKNFFDGMGKRKATTALLAVGEHVQDATQILDLLEDPEVADALGKANEAGVWDTVGGKWKNSAKNWFLSHGYATGTKAFEAMIRIGRITSEERRKMSGTAVTDSEIKTTRPWIPSGNDTFELMLQKMQIAKSEGEEIFNRTLNVYKDTVNMSPFYKAFGKERFGGKDAQSIMEKYKIR